MRAAIAATAVSVSISVRMAMTLLIPVGIERAADDGDGGVDARRLRQARAQHGEGVGVGRRAAYGDRERERKERDRCVCVRERERERLKCKPQGTERERELRLPSCCRLTSESRCAGISFPFISTRANSVSTRCRSPSSHTITSRPDDRTGLCPRRCGACLLDGPSSPQSLYGMMSAAASPTMLDTCDCSRCSDTSLPSSAVLGACSPPAGQLPPLISAIAIKAAASEHKRVPIM